MYVYRHDLDDTEEADDMYYDNPSEGIDAASNTNAVEGVHQAVNRGALDDVDVAAPGYAYSLLFCRIWARVGPYFR